MACVAEGDTVWGTKVSACPFDSLFANLDPQLWKQNVSDFFVETTREYTTQLYAGGAKGWQGRLFEHVGVMGLLFDIQNDLNIDYKLTKSTSPKRARVDYSLAYSRDGKMTRNQGRLHIWEETVNGKLSTLIYFGKAVVFEPPSNFPDYCANMTSFMQMGADTAAASCM